MFRPFRFATRNTRKGQTTVRLSALWLGLLGLLNGLACGKELVVGVQPYQSTRSMIAHHQKLAAHLSASLRRPTRIVTAKDIETYSRRMLAGEYDLVIGPGHLIRLAQLEKNWHPLARYVSDTPVLLLEREGARGPDGSSLKGRTLATPGRIRLVSLAAEHALAGQGLQPRRDYTVLETSSVGNAVHALVSGQVDLAVAALASLSEVRGSEVQQLQIVQEVATVPLLFFAANPDMPAAARALLQQALYAYETPQGVRTGALATQDLAAMDAYLEQTRRLLGIAAPFVRQAGR